MIAPAYCAGGGSWLATYCAGGLCPGTARGRPALQHWGMRSTGAGHARAGPACAPVALCTYAPAAVAPSLNNLKACRVLVPARCHQDRPLSRESWAVNSVHEIIAHYDVMCMAIELTGIHDKPFFSSESGHH